MGPPRFRCATLIVGKEFNNINEREKKEEKKINGSHSYQSQVSILGPVGYGPTTLPLCHSD